MAEIDYQAIAARMREQNEYPHLAMATGDYYSAQAIYALIRAMETMPEPPDVLPTEEKK